MLCLPDVLNSSILDVFQNDPYPGLLCFEMILILWVSKWALSGVSKWSGSPYASHVTRSQPTARSYVVCVVCLRAAPGTSAMSCQLITPSFVWPEHRFLRLIAHHWARAGMGLIEGSTDRGLADQQFDSVMATVRMDQPDQHLFQGQPWPTCPGMDKQSVRVVAFYQLALDQLHLGSSFELWLIKTPRTAHICAYKHVIKHGWLMVG